MKIFLFSLTLLFLGLSVFGQHKSYTPKGNFNSTYSVISPDSQWVQLHPKRVSFIMSKGTLEFVIPPRIKDHEYSVYILTPGTLGVTLVEKAQIIKKHRNGNITISAKGIDSPHGGFISFIYDRHLGLQWQQYASQNGYHHHVTKPVRVFAYVE